MGESSSLYEEGSPLVARARALLGAVVEGFEANDLLTFASAISFQILTAIIPFVLFVLALAGMFHANSVWVHHIEPKLHAELSPSMFVVVRNGVTRVFHGHRLLWVTVGGALSLWQVSGAVRAVMGALTRVYKAPGERPFLRRFTISIVLSIEVSLAFVLVAVCLLFAPFLSDTHPNFLWEAFAFAVRWLLVIAVLFVIVAVLVRHAPSRAQTIPWVSLGAIFVIGSWVIVSVLFYLYLNDIASYQSVFGNLASAIVAMAYLYLSATAFLFGVQLDAIVRSHHTGCASGHDPSDGD